MKKLMLALSSLALILSAVLTYKAWVIFNEFNTNASALLFAIFFQMTFFVLISVTVQVKNN